MTLFEALLAITLLVMLWGGIGAPQTDKPYQVTLAVRTFAGILTGASEVATTLSDGATIVVTPNGPTASLITTYAGRPDIPQGAVIARSTIDVPIALNGTDPSFAFAVAQNGAAVLIDPYTSWSAAASGGTRCTSVPLVVGKSDWAQNTTLDCTTLSTETL